MFPGLTPIRRIILKTVVGAAIASALTAVARADDKAKAIVEKAIQGQGGEDKVKKLRTMRIKVEGVMSLIPGQPATPFTIEDIWQMPDRYRTDDKLFTKP
jgi:hypothetical protein